MVAAEEQDNVKVTTNRRETEQSRFRTGDSSVGRHPYLSRSSLSSASTPASNSHPTHSPQTSAGCSVIGGNKIGARSTTSTAVHRARSGEI